MAITSMGIGSGLDIHGLVQQLVEAEGMPQTNRINRKEASYKAELSGLGSLKSALSEFQKALADLKDGSAFNTRTTTSSNEDLLTVSANSQAVAGSYDIEVLQLAEAHKLRTSDAYSFAGADAVVGTGTLTITVAGEPVDVVIDESNNTLAGIRDAINASDAGVTASIVNVDDGSGGTVSRMILTAKETGAANAVSITSADATGDLAALTTAQLTTVADAQDAQIKVDGLTATRSSNSISDVIDGLTLDLRQAEPGTELNVKVSLDQDAAKEAVQSFVDAYNGLMTKMQNLSSYDAESGKSGALNGDSMLRSIASRLRQEVATVLDSGSERYNTLASLGISTQRDGKLALDTAKFDEVLADDFDLVERVFSGDSGIAARFDTVAEEYLDRDGILELRLSGAQDRLDGLADERERLARRLEQFETRMIRQFSAMDQLVGQLQGTNSYLSQQLANLPFNNRSD